MIYIALALLGLFFSCDDAPKKPSSTTEEQGKLVIEDSILLPTKKKNPKLTIDWDSLGQSLPQAAFDGVEEFDSKNLSRPTNGWTIAKQKEDFIHYKHDSYNMTVGIKRSDWQDKLLYLHIYQQYEQSTGLETYKLDTTTGKYLAAKVFPKVNVNDFLMPQYQSDELEAYKGNISFMLDEKGQIQARLQTWMEPAFEEITDLNSVLIHWRKGQFIKEIIPVE